MALKPIFVATHPRSCSTAFERVFMTQTDTLKCVHEPFGDAFYYGPERLSERYETDEDTRIASGLSEATYKSVLNGIESQKEEGRRIFIKDMAQYLCPPSSSAEIAMSLSRRKRGVGTDIPINVVNGMDVSANGNLNTHAKPAKKSRSEIDGHGYRNPTVLPDEVLQQFSFVFLIRNPFSSVPSYYRCTIPPLVQMTGFCNFMPSEAGYRELRLLFDYLRSTGAIGPGIAGQSHSPSKEKSKMDICVIDADDLLDNPGGVVEAFCKAVGLKYDPKMLKWDTPAAQAKARAAFAKWQGFHEDALSTTELAPRTHKKKTKTAEQHYNDWVEKYGKEAADMLYKTVERNMKDYEYLKKFAMKV